MRNFKVPKSMVQNTLAGMPGGESAYTVPWALLVANDRSATLDVDMLAYTQPGGTVSMHVTRVGAKKWTVDLSKVPNDYVFTTSPHKSEHQVVENSEYIESDATQEAERVAKAEAWDEGFADGLRQDGEGDDGPRYVNPYRIERQSDG